MRQILKTKIAIVDQLIDSFIDRHDVTSLIDQRDDFELQLGAWNRFLKSIPPFERTL